jgi:hypothetical protein
MCGRISIEVINLSFPLTHLLVAYEICPSPQFLLGSISPDAVHYRGGEGYSTKAGIGALKKVTHLCPVSDEKWGQVTDNDGWLEIVRDFLHLHGRDEFAAGYACHALTDMYNNKSIWRNFREKFPAEAAKGYASEYYADMKAIDTWLYFNHPNARTVLDVLGGVGEALLWDGAPVSVEEVNGIRHNIVHIHFKDAREEPHNYKYVTPQDMMDFIAKAAQFCREYLVGV